MTEKTTAELIEKLRTHATVIPWLADAADSLESADQRAAEYAAVVKSARLYCENQGDKFRHHAKRILDILTAVPADTLRDVRPEDEADLAERYPSRTAEPQHHAGCIERCNHCQVCGTGILYGSRCPEHHLSTDREDGS